MKNFFSTIIFVALFSVLGFAAYTAIPRDSETVAGSPVNAAANSVASSASSAPQATQNFNMLAVPLDVSAQITDASHLATHLGSNIAEILKWNAEFQVYETWFPEFSAGDQFTVEVGDAFWVLADAGATDTVSFVGDVPPQTGETGAVVFDSLVGGTPCKLNDISIPLDQDAITNETQLATALGGSTNVEEILRWNAEFQVFQTWYPEFNAGDSFAVQIGYPYRVCLKNAPAEWPTTN